VILKILLTPFLFKKLIILFYKDLKPLCASQNTEPPKLHRAHCWILMIKPVIGLVPSRFVQAEVLYNTNRGRILGLQRIAI